MNAHVYQFSQARAERAMQFYLVYSAAMWSFHVAMAQMACSQGVKQ